MARERVFMAAVGRKGIGKSYQNIQLIKAYVEGNPQKGIRPQRVLVFDTNDEYGLNGIKAISLKDVALFSAQPFVQARRIRPINEKTGQPMKIGDMQGALEEILSVYRNGMLLIEDMNKFTSDTMKQDLIGALCTNRHLGLDIVTSLQGIGAITPKMWRNMNWLRLHKVSESVEKHKPKFEDKYEYLAIGQKMVDARYLQGGDNKRFFLNIDLSNDRIYGQYTKEEFDTAAQEFIYENFGAMVTPKLKHIDMASGKKKFTEQSAIEFEMARLYDTYSKFTVKD